MSTIQDIVNAVAANAKSQKWLSCTFQVTTPDGTFPVGVKAYGKWVQRIECCGLVDGGSEHKTLQALKAETEKLLQRMLARV